MTQPPSDAPAPLLTSPLLGGAGFSHGFSTRAGGVSRGPFASLNLARTVGDDLSHVAENTRRFCRFIGVEHVYEVTQVHGRDILEVREDDLPEALRAREADALFSRERGLALAVRTADCVPLLMADPRTRQVAAIHAGWRGVEAQIALAALAEFEEPARVLVAIGPHIRQAAFEVGEEVARALEAASSARAVRVMIDGAPHIDLAAILRAQLTDAGVPEAQIDDIPGCTFAAPARFFSYRRDGAETGRMLSAIVG